MIKMRDLLKEGVSENEEIYKLANLILIEFSKIPFDRLWQDKVELYDLRSHEKQFKYLYILFQPRLFPLTFGISGNQSYYNSRSSEIILAEDKFKESGNYLDSLKKSYMNLLAHELQHAYDDFRSRGKYTSDKKSKKYYWDDQRTLYAYLRLPHEVWARFTEISDQIKPEMIKSEIPEIIRKIEGWSSLNESMKRRILKAAYKLYDLKREKSTQ